MLKMILFKGKSGNIKTVSNVSIVKKYCKVMESPSMNLMFCIKQNV